MLVIAILSSALLIAVTISYAAYRQARTKLVAEDTIAITVDKDGFIMRVLPAGRHVLHPFEQVELTIGTKTKLAANKTSAITTGDGILVNIHWSGTYAVCPGLVAQVDNRSQKLRSLPNAEKAIVRNVDIYLRKLVGSQAVQELFKPAVRDRLERQLNQIVVDRLKPLGIALNGINLQALELPQEVVEALNKAKAIEALDGILRNVDPTTREVVRGVYQLDEVLHWDQYLPVPSRVTMNRLKTADAERQSR